MWTSDITYLGTGEGWLYLCAVRDGCSRRVIGWAIDDYLHTDLVQAALEMAVAMRGELAGQVVMTLLLAGHETTANTLAWTWISLLRNPTVYSKWQQQLRTQPQSARVITRNIAREGLRLYPASWIVGRVATIDGDFAGVPVPAGCTVSISPFVTHRHPQFWGPDPEAFDPDRHNRPLGHRCAWLPFGAGARMCLGSAYAMREMEISLSILGKHFHFHSEDARNATPRFRFTLGTPPIRSDIEVIGNNA